MVMPRTENPEVTVPGSSIIVLLPGASPIDLEKMVALPVEEAVNLEGLQRGLKIKVQMAGRMGDVSIRELLIPEQPAFPVQPLATPEQQGGQP